MDKYGNTEHYTVKLEQGTAHTVESYRRSHPQHSKAVQGKYIMFLPILSRLLRKSHRKESEMNMSTETTVSPPVEITYHWQGDYLIPDIGIPEEETALPSLTKWGLMRKNYLQNHRRIVYTDLKMSGKLFSHCYEIEEQATERMEFMIKQFTEHYNITEDLKAADPMKWL